MLALWGSNSHVGRHFDPMRAWGEWAGDLRGYAVPTGHYPAEHRPDLIYDAFWRFFRGHRAAGGVGMSRRIVRGRGEGAHP